MLSAASDATLPRGVPRRISDGKPARLWFNAGKIIVYGTWWWWLSSCGGVVTGSINCRGRFMGSEAAAVTSPIGLQNWNHSFAKSGELTRVPRRRWRKRRLQVTFLGLAIYEQTAGLQTYACNSNSVRTLFFQIPTAWGLPALQTRAKPAIHCKPMLPAVQTFG